MTGQVQIAKEHWGEDIPDWVIRLAEECEATSQNKVAAKTKISTAAISQSLRAKYPGNMRPIEDVVRGIFMSGTVECPALGNVEAHVCRDWLKKAKKFKASNAHRVRMHNACNNCPRNQQGAV